jgi:hypothetical protein
MASDLDGTGDAAQCLMKAIFLLVGLTVATAFASTRCATAVCSQLWLIASLCALSLLLATVLMHSMRRRPLQRRTDLAKLGLSVVVGLALMPFVGVGIAFGLLAILPLLLMYLPSFHRRHDQPLMPDHAEPGDPDHRVRPLPRP